MARERLISGVSLARDVGESAPAERVSAGTPSLRPVRLDELIGQQKVIDRLGIALSAAKERRETLGHVLMAGPPGLGKTTLARVIATELNSQLRETSGPALVRTGDLMTILMSLEPSDVLFIDEIHRLPKIVEEYLYPAMEDFKVDYTSEQGLGSRTVNFPLPRFTLIGATTRKGLLTGALRDRFQHQYDFEFYTPDELEQIVARSAAVLGCGGDQPAFRALAERSRGTPRVANRLLQHARDYASVRNAGRLTPEVVGEALGIHEVDALGLDALDRRYLHVLIDVYNGGPAGIEAIAASLRDDRDTLEDTVEPYLLQIGFVRRTPKGREVTGKAYRHLGIQPPATSQTPGGLFEA